MSVLMATRPTRLASPTLAIPCTTVQKMIGATIMRTSRMNRSPSGLSESALCGHRYPIRLPRAMAARICTDRSLYRGGARRLLTCGVLTAVAISSIRGCAEDAHGVGVEFVRGRTPRDETLLM